MTAENAFLKITWRHMGMIVPLLIMGFIIECRHGIPVFEWSRVFKDKVLLFNIVVTSIAQFFCVGFFILGGTYLIVSHGVLLQGFSSLFLVIWGIVTTFSVNKFEIIGTLIAVLGGFILTQDQAA